jgi:hypothetical protein
MERVVAVVTCDIFQSQKYSTEQRRTIDSLLKKEFKKLATVYENAIHTPASFSMTMGDEFQFVIGRVEKAYEITVFYRALVAIKDLTPMVQFRSSIGVGEIAVQNRRDSYSEDGKAFHRSRLGIQRLRDHKHRGKRRSVIVTGDRTLDETLDLVLMYQDLLEKKWTQAQWEAVRWRLMSTTYEDIAKKINVAYQNVQKRLRAANWEESKRGFEFVQRALAAHLKEGVDDNFTSSRV